MISATPGREVRQELYLNTQYEKARQDVGLFFYFQGLTFKLHLFSFTSTSISPI